jgi:hypothetical protein
MRTTAPVGRSAESENDLRAIRHDGFHNLLTIRHDGILGIMRAFHCIFSLLLRHLGHLVRQLFASAAIAASRAAS